ncbi:MAG TPA: 3-oxoacyl-ACP reductase FabG [Candidatus Pacearchaeota archaeon]|nr:3-oxoacyl-ACP reductase FabG [Candidatus Pacearchaeota archaeon]HPR79840.1 3-oxoacyl-ACP reductase FabG [Candidatus Pacearchaeota archaeon]
MFKDKVVLITGASQGIGRVMALKFASLGAKVALNDIPQQEESLKKVTEETGGKYFLADVSKMDQVEKMMMDIQKELGGLNVLVNNAGITKDRTLAKMTVEEWQKVIDINLTGVFNCSKAALALLIPSQGNIVNVSSIVGQRGNFGQANYSASKAGIIGFTKSVSKELGRFNVRVNAVAPGFIETKMAEAIPEELKVMVRKLTSLGRFGKPEEVASTVVFLASPEASFITGEIINIDGGLSL